MHRGRNALRRLGLAGSTIAVVGAFIACVGDDPGVSSPGPVGNDANTPDSVATGTDGGGTDAPSSADAGDTPDAADAAPELPSAVASALTEPVSLAITNQTAIILTETKVLRCAQKTCGTPVVIADTFGTDLTPPSPRPYMIDADDNAFHFIAQAATTTKFLYFSCDLALGCPGVMAKLHPSNTEVLGPVGLALGPDGFARIGMKGMILACDATTCPAITGVDVDATRAIAVDGTTVVYTDMTDPGAGTKLSTVGVAGSTKFLHSTVGHVVAVQGANVYTLAPTKIVMCAKSGCSGVPTTFIDNEVGLTSMAVGPSGVYWTSNGASVGSGTVKMCPLTGCSEPPRIIASGQTGPTSIRLHGGTVFWINRGIGGATGALMRAGQ